MRRLVPALFGLCLASAAMAADETEPTEADEAKPAEAEESAPAPARIGVLRGLDKITARVTPLEIPVGGSADFGTLHIKLDTCNKRPPEETPEVAAFLEIDEVRPGDAEATRLFSGWMFASSPALSALEHPVYDVWVIDCKIVEVESSAPEQKKSAD